MEEALAERPADFLVDHVSLLPKGRVLDVAMGSGRNAIYLARLGYQVEGVDISAEALAAANAAAARAGVIIRSILADLEDGYRIAPARYDVIVCFNYLHRPLAPAIVAGLRPAGVLVYETFTLEQLRFGKPRNPDHLLRPNELLALFGGLRVLRYREGVFDPGRAVAGLVARQETGQPFGQGG